MARPRTARLLYLASMILALTGGAAAGMPALPLERLFPGAVFDPAIPSQQGLLGIAPGSRPLRHDELIRYFEALERASPRARLVEYARTHEDRPLVVLAVGDEAVVGDLEGFRAEHADRMDPRGRRESEDVALIAQARAVAWMAYGIHGDELSSTDAAAALAYWLVAGEDERAVKIRRELLVLIDPCENPDGRERFLAQTGSFAHAAPNPDSEDLSHTAVWPWGRGNHYLFDLNRDWFTQVQPESRRSSVIATWNPQLMVDSHEMGASDTYLFSPARHPYNPFRPTYQRQWASRYAADQARALDTRGYAYYTREWNEEFFPGYGSAWATYLGAVGILYEMSGTEGTLVRQRPGTTRTFPEAVEHQVTSSVANLETLAANRGEALRDYVKARRDAVHRGAEGPVRAWVFPRRDHPERVDALGSLLRRQGIEALRLEEPVKATGLTDARTGASVETELPRGSWMVPLDQPAYPLARVILDPHVPMEREFLREEREYLERGRGTRVYDTTAWSLPLAWGLEAYWSGAKPPGQWTEGAPEPPRGSFTDTASPYGYLFDGSSDGAVAALADLLETGLAVRVAEKPFRVAGRSYAPGTILVKREGNPEDLAARLAALAHSRGIRVDAVPTAKAEEGPDLGGHHFHPLVAPRVGVLTGMPVSPSAYGAIWHLFDQGIELRFTALDVAYFRDVDLSRYNVLVFPPIWGAAERYRVILGSEGMERLRRWIDAGGTVIGIGSGAAFLADEQTGWTATRMRSQALDKHPPVVLGIAAEQAAEAGLFRAVGVKAPPPDEEEGKKKTAEGVRRATQQSKDPWDIAPVIGPGAAPFVAGVELGTPVAGPPMDLAQWIRPLLPPGKEKPDPEDLKRADERLRGFSPRGAFLRVEVDPEIWLAWGLPRELAAWTNESDALVAEPPVQVAARFADIPRLHLGGLLWPEAAGRLARTAYATREAVGRGQVILFLEEPGFRGWTLGTRRLLINAVLEGPGLGTRWSVPW